MKSEHENIAGTDTGRKVGFTGNENVRKHGSFHDLFADFSRKHGIITGFRLSKTRNSVQGEGRVTCT